MPLDFCLSQNDDCCGQNIVNAEMSQGETVAYQMAFTSDGSTPLNLTGCSIFMQIGFPSPLLFETGGPSGQNFTIPTPANGIAILNMSKTLTENFMVGNYPYDIFLIDDAGNSTRYFGGTWTIDQSETPIT